jgi:hypothetical protein
VAGVLTGCGSGDAPSSGAGRAARLAQCLDGMNSRQFLVQAQSNRILGSSPGGVAFSIRLYPTGPAARAAAGRLSGLTSTRVGDAVVSWAGNPPAHPGGAPGRLAAGDLRSIEGCLSAS